MANTSDTTRLHDSLSFHTTVAARMMERRVEDGLRDHGITRTGWCVLVSIFEEGLARPSEIAEFVGIDRTGTSRTLRHLEDAGLITRQIAQGDRRNTDIRITEAGKRKIAEAGPTCQENMDHFADKLSATERDDLMRLLKKLKY